MGAPEAYAGWGLMSVYLVAVMIVWTAVIAGILLLVRRFAAGHRPAPADHDEPRPDEGRAA